MSLNKKKTPRPDGVTVFKDHGAKINLYSGTALAGIREACHVAAEVLDRLCQVVTPGMSTYDLDCLAGEFMKEAGCKSADFGYYGFPRQICISLNDVVVHGIGRKEEIIREGDIVSLDITVNKNGFIGDNARSFAAGGTCSPLAQRLMDATRQSLMAGIAAAHPGNTVADIGKAVEGTVKPEGFSVVRDMVGHGCGISMHEEPQVPNYWTQGAPKLQPGMVICIEPMINAGTWRIVIDKADGWTVRTADGSLSAHFEHQILITDNEAEILTWPRNA